MSETAPEQAPDDDGEDIWPDSPCSEPIEEDS